MSAAAPDGGRSDLGRWRLLLLGATVGWVVLAAVLLLRPTVPDLWLASPDHEHLALSLLLGLLVTAVWASAGERSTSELGWRSILTGSAAVVALELIQGLVPVRAIQLADVAHGLAGVLGGTLLGVVVARRAGRLILVAATATVGAVAVLVGAALAVFRPPVEPVGSRIPVTVCPDDGPPGAAGDLGTDGGSGENGSWTIRFAGPADPCVASTIGPLAPFGAVSVGPAGASGPESISFDGGGVVSAPLPEVRRAVAASDALTLGVRLRLRDRTLTERPATLARLSVDGPDGRPVARLIQRGPHLAGTVWSGDDSISLAATLADAVTDDDLHDVAVTYAEGRVALWLDGVRVSSAETGRPIPLDPVGEPTLSLGRRVDQVWEPLDGEIVTVLIADRAMEPDEITAGLAP